MILLQNWSAPNHFTLVVVVFSSLAVDRPIKSHSGAQGNFLVGPLWGEILEFFFTMVHFGVL